MTKTLLALNLGAQRKTSLGACHLFPGYNPKVAVSLGLTRQPATRTGQPLAHPSPSTQWDEEENGQKVKLMG